MRLTIDLIMQSPQYISPSKNWTLSLRGCKIDVIENLGATGDHFESLDLSDNEIIKLANFPMLNHLNTLVLCNNRISRIDSDLCDNLPNLISLVLTNNKIERLTDLQPLFKSNKLQRLSFADNPVCEVPYYKAYLIYHMPHLRFLDFKRIRDEDRKQAQNTFEGEKGKKLVQEIAPPRKTQQRGEGGTAPPERQKDAGGLTPEQLDVIKKAIGKASTLEEISRLENALKQGVMPDGVHGPTDPIDANDNPPKQ